MLPDHCCKGGGHVSFCFLLFSCSLSRQLSYETGPHWTTVWRRHSNAELNSEPWRWLDRSIMSELRMPYLFCALEASMLGKNKVISL